MEARACNSWTAIGNESGATADSIRADTLGVYPNGDRVLMDDDGELVAVFPQDYAVIREQEEDEDE